MKVFTLVFLLAEFALANNLQRIFPKIPLHFDKRDAHSWVMDPMALGGLTPGQAVKDIREETTRFEVLTPDSHMKWSININPGKRTGRYLALKYRGANLQDGPTFASYLLYFKDEANKEFYPLFAGDLTLDENWHVTTVDLDYFSPAKITVFFLHLHSSEEGQGYLELDEMYFTDTP